MGKNTLAFLEAIQAAELQIKAEGADTKTWNSPCPAKSYSQERRRLPSSRRSGRYKCSHNGPCEIHFQVVCLSGVSDGGETNVVVAKAKSSQRDTKHCAISLKPRQRAKMMAVVMSKYRQDCGVRMVMANAMTLSGVSLKHEPRCCRCRTSATLAPTEYKSDTRHDPRSTPEMQPSNKWNPTPLGNVIALVA